MFSAVAALAAEAPSFDAPQPMEELAGGATTTDRVDDEDALSLPSANLKARGRMDFEVGNSMFRRNWVSAPASTKASDGLGPLFNARACQSCHIKDGRGHLPTANWPQDDMVSMLFKLGVPAKGEGGALEFVPDPIYGAQIQDFAIQGFQPEAKVEIRYEEKVVRLGDEEVRLRRPLFTLRDLAYGDAHPDLVMSARLAQPMTGLGLLAAIGEAAILAGADPDDADGDGISGRANWGVSQENGERMLGRFGWKASVPTLADQSAIAFANDMGLSTPLILKAWGDCTARQPKCREAPHGNPDDPDGPELSRRILELVTFYSANLAVPIRRGVGDAEVLRGKAAFHGIGCVGCHTPSHRTGDEQPTELAAQRSQLIWPYTDLLLHDMGEELADGLPEGEASGSEWRTPPLWGIGLAKQVSAEASFLHDGRARTLLEAILWHGGEAQASVDRFKSLTPKERTALLTFLNSL